jgi:hypothetical protein
MLIGIAGKKRSGKDTAARALVAQLGFRQIAFADPLKALAASFLGWPVEAVRDDAFKEAQCLRDMTGRELLQGLGTAVRETFGADFWVERAMSAACDGGPFHPFVSTKTRPGYCCQYDYNAASEADRCYRTREQHRDVVISDVRYESEMYAIKMAGGAVIRLNRTDGAEAGDSHPSEIELPESGDRYDAVFNCASAEEAAARVVEWVKLKRNGGKAC